MSIVGEHVEWLIRPSFERSIEIDMESSPPPPLSIREFQSLIDRMYSSKDAARGVDGTFMWLMEEVGELASALRSGDRDELALEFADVIAWVVTLANITDIDLTDALHRKYGQGCPGCLQMVCRCDQTEKP